MHGEKKILIMVDWNNHEMIMALFLMIVVMVGGGEE